MNKILPNQIDIEKIRKYRYYNGLTITQFCKKCGFSYGVYKKIVNGDCNFKSSNLLKMARAMEIEISKLFVKL